MSHYHSNKPLGVMSHYHSNKLIRRHVSQDPLPSERQVSHPYSVRT